MEMGRVGLRNNGGMARVQGELATDIQRLHAVTHMHLAVGSSLRTRRANAKHTENPVIDYNV